MNETLSTPFQQDVHGCYIFFSKNVSGKVLMYAVFENY